MTDPQFRAKWDFKAFDRDQIGFRKGEIITLLGEDPSGWWLGEIRRSNGRIDDGLFPSNFTEKIKSTSGITNRLEASSSLGRLGDNESVAQSASSVFADDQRQSRVHILDTKLLYKGGDAETRRKRAKPRARTVFRVWAHIMAMYGISSTLIVLGLLALLYGAEEEAPGSGGTDVAIGVLSVFVGGLIGLYEWASDGEPIIDALPIRPTLWITMGCICFVSFPMWTAGAFLYIASIVDIIGYCKDEQYVEPRKKRKTAKDKEQAEYGDGEMSCCARVEAWFIMRHEENKLARLVFCCLFLSANIAFFIYTVVIWTDAVNDMAESERLSLYAPYAKGFGAVIDINSSLLLIPVCRTLIRVMYNKATKDEACSSRALRILFDFVPLDKSLMLHQQLAKLSLLGVVGHTIFHFVNYSLRPDPTVDRFGLWPFYSGVILLILCYLIYTGAQEVVKRPTFEIFWYSHHLFVFYFLITLLHGAGGWNPNFWKFFIIPGTLYISERMWRAWRAGREVVLLSAMTMEPNLLSIEMDKKSAFGEKGFNEGQYVFANCPSVKPYEWHPFTISSPPQNETFTLHIQTQGPGSWTEMIKKYLMSMGPRGSSFVKFERYEKGKRVPGKIKGPNGLKLILIDGPHSAPTQHMREYEVAMIAGAGIGLTPVIACAESIVYHRWKFSTGKTFPSHAHFFWVVSHRDLEAYRWFIVKVTRCQDAVLNMRKKGGGAMKDKSFRFTIFVTSVPKTVDAKFVTDAMQDEKRSSFWGPAEHKTKVQSERALFDKAELYRYLLRPTEPRRTFQDIQVIVGRPKWSEHFAELSKSYPNKDIGVMFCGNRHIGKDLKAMCAKYSSIERKQFFRLHKENF